MKIVNVYTDGGSKYIDDRWYGGAGVYYEAGEEKRGMSYPMPDGTVNMAELNAYNTALKLALDKGWKHVVIHSDSKYVIDHHIGPLHRWKKNGWKTMQGGDVANKSFWQTTDELQARFKENGVFFSTKKVPAHSGIDGNEKADALATEGRVNAHKGILEVVEHDYAQLPPEKEVKTKTPKVKVTAANPFLALSRIIDITHEDQPKTTDGRTIYRLSDYPKDSDKDDDDETSKRKKAEAKTRNLGVILPDTCLSLTLLKEPCQVYSQIREMQNETAPKSAGYPFITQWDRVTSKARWESIHLEGFKKNIKRHTPNLYLLHDGKDSEQVTFLQAIPRLAYNALDDAMSLLYDYDKFKAGELQTPAIDITDLFKMPTKKGSVPKKTTEFDAYSVVQVPHGNKTVEVRITPGVDFPKIPNTMRILKADPDARVYLIKKIETEVMFRIAIIIEGKDNASIFTSPASNLQLVP